MGLTRAFVAISLPDRISDALARIADGTPTGRAVDADNLHLTLVFLGELDDEILEDVHEALLSIRAPAFAVQIDGLGQFGGDRPRSLWASVQSIQSLTRLQSKVASAVRGAGVDLARRRFVPHITLARFGGAGETPELQRFIASHAGLSFGPVAVHSFGLFASHLGRGGARYDQLATYPLASPAAGNTD